MSTLAQKADRSGCWGHKVTLVGLIRHGLDCSIVPAAVGCKTKPAFEQSCYSEVLATS